MRQLFLLKNKTGVNTNNYCDKKYGAYIKGVILADATVKLTVMCLVSLSWSKMVSCRDNCCPYNYHNKIFRFSNMKVIINVY